MSMLDRLARLEQLGWLPSENEWMQLRRIRNEIPHEYLDQEEARFAAIMAAIDAASALAAAYRTWRSKLTALEKNSRYSKY